MTNIDKVKTKSPLDVGFLIPIHKPVGMTSFDVIRFFKKKFKLTRHDKIGHFGTLDPFAEGLLLVGLGRVLRLMPFVHDLCPKSYLAVGSVGVKTISGDYTGEKVALSTNINSETWAMEIMQSDEGLFKQHGDALVGKYLQSRPYFSAAKLDGVPLYEYARRGELIDVPKVERTIYEFEMIKKGFAIQTLSQFYPGDLTAYPHDLGQMPLIIFRSLVGTGTYVRTLFEDYCALLGGVGHLVALYRDRIGPVSIEHALNLQDFETYETVAQLAPHAVDPLQLLPLPQVWPNDTLIQKLKWGQKIPVTMLGEQTSSFAWVMANAPSGAAIVGLLRRDAVSAQLVLHWDPEPGN
ncbi:MAG: hypothetical protein A2X86_16840 [Bdellovibrionales bacterium GWA2_49_15]|nr:MAG: hypothetical protein A2X86_16840 [Bdellovibrionales bacterium GWA2_49_15]